MTTDIPGLAGLFAAGAVGTLQLFIFALAISLTLGTVLAAMRVSPTPVLRGAATVYITVVRNTPLTLVMFFCVFGLPYLEIRFSPVAGLNSFAYAVLALSAYSACFVAETLRSGISAVPVGQAEASRAIGMTFSQSLGYVVLPQAFRTVIPPLGSVVIALLKNTSIASGFNNRELISAMRAGIELRGDLVIPILIGTAATYLLLALGVGRVFGALERKLVITR